MNQRICVEIDGIFYKSLYQAHLNLGFDKKTIKKRCESDLYDTWKIVDFRVTYTHKTCSKCKEEKPLLEFRQHGDNLDGRYSWCNSCHSKDNMLRDKKDRSKPRERSKRFRDSEKGKIFNRISKATRRAREHNAKVDLTKEERIQIKDIYTKAKNFRESGLNMVVDHIIPLSRGGKHHPNNLRIVDEHFNLVKSNKLDIEL